MDKTTGDKNTFVTVKTCGLCSHMRLSNKGLIAECEMSGKGKHPGIKFHRQPNGEFNTFAWLKARDCAHYDGDDEDEMNEETA